MLKVFCSTKCYIRKLLKHIIRERKNAKHQSGGGRPAKIFNKQAKKRISNWSITKMACPKENSLVALNAHNHMQIELLRVMEYKNTRNKQKRSTKVSQ